MGLTGWRITAPARIPVDLDGLRDGAGGRGFDIALTRAIADAVRVPVTHLGRGRRSITSSRVFAMRTCHSAVSPRRYFTSESGSARPELSFATCGIPVRSTLDVTRAGTLDRLYGSFQSRATAILNSHGAALAGGRTKITQAQRRWGHVIEGVNEKKRSIGARRRKALITAIGSHIANGPPGKGFSAEVAQTDGRGRRPLKGKAMHHGRTSELAVQRVNDGYPIA